MIRFQQNFSTVHYQTLDDAIDLILDLGAGSFLAKSGLSPAWFYKAREVLL